MTRETSRWRRLLPRLILALLLTLLLIEGGARVVLSVIRGDAGIMLYPLSGEVVVNHVVAHAVQEHLTASHHPPSQNLEYSVGGRTLHVIKINASGYRGRDLSSPRKARYRVVAMGGSTTFSPECPDGTTYPEQLERLWNERHGAGTVEVINMGKTGLATSGVVDLFQTVVAPTRPDLVTVSSAFNAAYFPLLLDLRPGRAPLYRRLLWQRSVFYTALLQGVMGRRNHGQELEQVKVRYRGFLEQLISTAREYGTKLLFVTQPLGDIGRVPPEVMARRVPRSEHTELRNNFTEGKAQQAVLNKIMIELARERGVALADPRPAMLAHPKQEDYFWVALHMTPRGSLVFARQIVEQVQARYHGLPKLMEKR